MLILLTALACYQENIPEVDFTGTVVLPRAAATRLLPTFDADGNVNGSQEVTDTRLIGPIFLGAYSGIDTNSFAYPHPSMGPIVDSANPGNAFPYGGTSVGRYDFACYDMLACKVVTGRFSDYDDVLEYFRLIGRPVTNFDGTEIENGSTYQQQCYYYYYATSDEEISFIGAEDFSENAAGDFEAEFHMPHTTFTPGMVMWGFMDAPIISALTTDNNGTFTTCSTTDDNYTDDYNNTYSEGEQVPDALNYPSLSITTGDWVGDGNTVIESADDAPTINLSFQYTGE